MSNPPLYLLETQLALRVIMNPVRARDVATGWLSPLPQQLIELVAMAPQLCSLVGIGDFIGGCFDFAKHPDREKPQVVAYAEWLEQASPASLAALPPYDEIMRDLERIVQRSVDSAERLAA